LQAIYRDRRKSRVRLWEIRQGDALERLREMPDESVHCCVTSPPYWGLRDYGVSGQLGLEKTPELYVSKMTEVFREVRRVLRCDGTLWLNIGDSYAASGKGWGGGSISEECAHYEICGSQSGSRRKPPNGYKPKDLCGIPWLVAFALRADDWYLRQDIIWSKPNPMPESVTDRCTKAHEYLFLLSKSARYYYDAKAIKEPWSCDRLDMAENGLRTGMAYLEGNINNSVKPKSKIKVPGGWDRGDGAHGTIHRNGRTSAEYQDAEVSPFRNKRSVWEIPTSPFPEAHFATFPPKLIEPCILAGCPEGGTVLDPFCGAGVVASGGSTPPS